MVGGRYVGSTLLGKAKIESFFSRLEHQINVWLLKASVANGHGSWNLSLNEGRWCPDNTEFAKKQNAPIGFEAMETLKCQIENWG